MPDQNDGMTDRTEAELERTVLAAGALALEATGSSRGATKRDGSWVTRTDRLIERRIRARLHALADARVYGEEEGWSGPADAAHVAVIDPIDGTDAYRSQLPFWGVSVAVLERVEGTWTPAAGIFHMPACGHTFVSRGRRSFWNGRPLRLRKRRSPIPATSYLGVSSDAHRWHLAGYPGKVRGFGASGLHVAFVAAGLLHAALLTSYYTYDIAGAALVLWGAGGKLYDLDRKPLTPSALVERAVAKPASHASPLIACHPANLDDLIGCRLHRRRAP
jgi:fructose-1,6-bisphosphatase/inositol monophosphatase family enzyme